MPSQDELDSNYGTTIPKYVDNCKWHSDNVRVGIDLTLSKE
jgi:hypothetical protein